jgi:hypothetical protein
MDDPFVIWYAVRYGAYPTKQQTFRTKPLYLWARKQRNKGYRGVRHPVTNRHVMRQRLLQEQMGAGR